jgi:rare lipoprotein A
VPLGFHPHNIVLVLLVASLAACRSTPPSETSSSSPAGSGGRYALENDVPVNEPIDLAAIRDVIPKVEKRTSAGNKSPYTISGRTYRVIGNEAGFSETGMASWYGRKFHGHLTANGEQYDMFQLSAAHTTLPIPSYIKVTNLDNGRSVVARVNDRGPFHPGRVVDMSYAGAILLGYAKTGTARVRVESIVPDGAPEPTNTVQPVMATPAPTVSTAPVRRPLPPTVPKTEQKAEQKTAPTLEVKPDQKVASKEDAKSEQNVGADVSVEEFVKERALIEANTGSDYLQVGAFGVESSARNLQRQLQAAVSANVVIHSEASSDGKTLYKVRVGPLINEAQTQAAQKALTAAGIAKPFKVRH